MSEDDLKEWFYEYPELRSLKPNSRNYAELELLKKQIEANPQKWANRSDVVRGLIQNKATKPWKSDPSMGTLFHNIRQHWCKQDQSRQPLQMCSNPEVIALQQNAFDNWVHEGELPQATIKQILKSGQDPWDFMDENQRKRYLEANQFLFTMRDHLDELGPILNAEEEERGTSQISHAKRTSSPKRVSKTKTPRSSSFRRRQQFLQLEPTIRRQIEALLETYPMSVPNAFYSPYVLVRAKAYEKFLQQILTQAQTQTKRNRSPKLLQVIQQRIVPYLQQFIQAEWATSEKALNKYKLNKPHRCSTFCSPEEEQDRIRQNVDVLRRAQKEQQQHQDGGVFGLIDDQMSHPDVFDTPFY